MEEISMIVPRQLFQACAVVLGIVLGLSAADSNIEKPDGRVPVLLELFTSEGCSSCPPADALLQRLDREQPLEGTKLVVISEHVDYWNHLGWTDPYSSRIFSDRQEEYASRFDSDVYTPQLVVDGSAEVVGGNWAKAEHAIKAATGHSKMALSINGKKQGSHALVHIQAPAKSDNESGQIYVVLASDSAQSHVTRGENKGRELTHTAVAYYFKRIGNLSKNGGVQKDIQLELKPGATDGSTRAIVFIQKAGAGQIIGVAETRL